MPHRLSPFTAKIQFLGFAAMPALIYRACKATGTPSNTAYIQDAVCAALARDLDMDLEDLRALLPPRRGRAAALFGADRTPERRDRDQTATMLARKAG